jgi:hypothetical protein
VSWHALPARFLHRCLVALQQLLTTQCVGLPCRKAVGSLQEVLAPLVGGAFGSMDDLLYRFAEVQVRTAMSTPTSCQ